MGGRYVGVRMLKAMWGDPMSREMMARTRTILDFVPRDDFPVDLVPDPDPAHLKPAKAPQLRKLINEAFHKLFATGERKRPGGETEYTGALQSTNIAVAIDFSARGPQLRYGVKTPDETKTSFGLGTRLRELMGRRAPVGITSPRRMRNLPSVYSANTSQPSCRFEIGSLRCCEARPRTRTLRGRVAASSYPRRPSPYTCPDPTPRASPDPPSSP